MPAPRKYPDELRERAVREVREVRTTGRPIAHVAKDLGIHKEALRGWVRQAEVDHGERNDRLTTAEHDELKQLRKEVAELRRANEILKAASVFFAQEIDRPRTRPSR
ncbi:transposase [Streptomyces sp. NPDC102274]|uniref:transposase n=1 Tax=Streptomyces sp. NPDC102274 TaxID=3366151 RepID=UPI0038131E3A